MKLKKWQIGCLITLAILLCGGSCLAAAMVYDTVKLLPTATPSPAPTSSPTIYARPTLTPGPPYCVCFGRMIECAEFPNQEAAQECLLNCRILGYDDYYQLDPDGNGRACSP